VIPNGEESFEYTPALILSARTNEEKNGIANVKRRKVKSIGFTSFGVFFCLNSIND
jgi:hypothetical protein